MENTKYGRLTVIEEAPSNNPKYPYVRMFRCVCDCGTVGLWPKTNVLRGVTKSCGCYRREWAAEAKSTHRQTGSKEWTVWAAMKRRCNNPNCKDFPNYGGRGIKVCPAWEKFEGFLQDMGKRPSDKHTIDRIDSSGDYSPENCRWATQKEQQNNRRNNRRFESNGESLTLSEWANRFGVTPFLLRYHLVKQGKTVEQAAAWFAGQRASGLSYKA